MVDSFCHSGDCGSYQPDGQLSHGFSFTRVRDELGSPLHWLVSTWEVHLEKVGSYCGLAGGIIFLAYYLWMSISWICRVARSKRLDNDLKIGLSVTNYLPTADEHERPLSEEEPAARPREPAQYQRKYPVLPPSDLEDEDESPSLG